MKSYVNRGHASAQQLKRELADSDWNNAHLRTCVGEEPAQCEVCQAFEKAPHFPAAGTSTAAMFHQNLNVDLLFLGDIIALHVMALSSKYSPLIPVRTKTPQEVRDAFYASRVGVFGPPMIIQMDEGGEW